MIKSEFLRFMQTLNPSTVPANVRKIANIIFDNMDILIPLSTASGHRIKKIVELSKATFSDISEQIPPLPEQETQPSTTLKMVKNLSVGPFRGFIKNEVFDLDSRLVLMYGPNGTGKSSFCEALEYSLLGNVAEAESKRFNNLEAYLKNAHIDMFMEPVLIGIDSLGDEVPIIPNDALYRFCFVEKNRIDNFARIAAQAPSRQTELISTLFGLDAFADFVKNFTETMDERYIDLTGIEALALSEKRQSLAGKHEQIKTSTDDLENISREEQELANSYRDGCTFSQMIIELNGAGEKIGLIQQLEEEVQKPIPSKKI